MLCLLIRNMRSYTDLKGFFMQQNISFPLHCFNFQFVLSALISLRRVFWQKIWTCPLPPLKHLDEKGFGVT